MNYKSLLLKKIQIKSDSCDNISSFELVKKFRIYPLEEKKIQTTAKILPLALLSVGLDLWCGLSPNLVFLDFSMIFGDVFVSLGF